VFISAGDGRLRTDENWSCKALAERYGIHLQTVYYTLRKAGVTPQKGAEGHKWADDDPRRPGYARQGAGSPEWVDKASEGPSEARSPASWYPSAQRAGGRCHCGRWTLRMVRPTPTGRSANRCDASCTLSDLRLCDASAKASPTYQAAFAQVRRGFSMII